MSEGFANPVAAGRDVFVSYASHDAAIANAAVEQLEGQGIKCWCAPRDVTPGSQYADEIVGAINNAKIVVLVLSEHAVASPHVGKEIERASSKQRRIITLRIDAAPLTRSFEYFLSESQWIDVAALGMPGALTRLTQAVGQALAPSSWVSSGLGAEATNLVDRKRKPSYLLIQRVVAAALLLVVAAIVVGVLARYWPSRQKSAPAPTVAGVADKSIAVLPFADLSEKHDQEYFADGISEEVLNRLAQVPGLRVVGRASSFRFRGKDTNLLSVAAALNVTYVLEGNVRKDADRVRVSAQLLDARTGSQRWSDRFDSSVVDVLQVQDSIAAALARALQIVVEGDTARRSTTKSPDALDAYLRGLQSADRGSREGAEAAVAFFQRTISLDPMFAPAAIGLARTHAYIGDFGWMAPRIAFERAREAALLAERLDPESPLPHVYMAQIHFAYDLDWAGADRELQRAFALAPRDSRGAQTASWLAAIFGRWDEAQQLGIEAVALDPLNADVYETLGYNVYLPAGKFAEAEQAFRRGLQIAPKYGGAHYFLGEALMLQGHYDAALTEFRQETPDDGQPAGSAMAYFAAGRKAESDTQLAEMLRVNGTDWPYGIAGVYAFRGEKDRAFEWLDRAYEARDHLFCFKGDPLLKNIEGDPRYKAFLKKMNLPE